jgi:hypothetical protein
MTPSEKDPSMHHNGPAAWLRLLIVVLGIVLGQAILYGPSLIGKRILLPLDLLSGPSAYLPAVPGKMPTARNFDQLDLIDFNEPERIVAGEEIAAGRFPLWNPHRLGGTPLYRLSFSPLWIPAYFVRTPVILAWVQMLTALVAGLGLYTFCRREVSVSFWPAAFVSWCYPLSGAFLLWTGWYLPAVMCWLPWTLVAVGAAICRPWGLGAPALSVITAFMLLGGAQDIAGQILLVSGIYACWKIFDHYGFRGWWRRRMLALGVVVAAWGIGIAASAWLLLPIIDYAQTGIRTQARSAGVEERPPVGFAALPQIVLPNMYGAMLSDSYRIARDPIVESSAGGYAGLLATLLMAPMALASRRHRSINAVLLTLLLVSVSWVLNLPGFVQVLRLPVLNMMSHNRLVFVVPMAILALVAIGLDQWRGKVDRRWWFEIPIVAMILVAAWCIYRALVPPLEIAENLALLVSARKSFWNVTSNADVAAVQHWFTEHYIVAAGLAILGLIGWYCIRFAGRLPRVAVGAVVVLMYGELLYFGFGRAGQTRPSLYYPPLAVIQQIKASAPGRVMGFACMPSNFSAAVGLDDIRGYDGVDPKCMSELVLKASLPVPPESVNPCARTQWVAPIMTVTEVGSGRVSPILSMLNVRYILFRSPLPSPLKADIAGDDYWIFINRNALPRAFVPHHVQVVADPQERLEKLAQKDFDPSEVAYVEKPLELPETAIGSASIERDLPTEVTLAADMQTPGLLVLADNWDSGWSVSINGSQATLLRVNHAVRGVVVPAGKSTIAFRFEPMNLRRGFWISGIATLSLTAWTICVVLRRRAGTTTHQSVTITRGTELATAAASTQ